MFKPSSPLSLCAGLLLACSASVSLAEPGQGRGGPPDWRVQRESTHPGGHPDTPRAERQLRVETDQGWRDSHPREAQRSRVSIDFEQIRLVVGGHRDHWRPQPALPPGIRKNLQRGKPLPPGIARQRLDGRLERELPRYPGHEWVRVGNDLVLVSATTRLIEAVLDDMFR